MKVTKRVYCLHDGSYNEHEITKFVNKNGDVCNHTHDYVWWQNLGLFTTKSKASSYAKEHHIKLDIHSMVVHSDWMYKIALNDMVK